MERHEVARLAAPPRMWVEVGPCRGCSRPAVVLSQSMPQTIQLFRTHLTGASPSGASGGDPRRLAAAPDGRACEPVRLRPLRGSIFVYTNYQFYLPCE